MICSRCGAQNDDEAEKCKECGWRLRSQLAVNDQVCVNHPWRFAVSVCHACGIELCEACEVFLDDVAYCKECADRPDEDVLLQHVHVVEPAQAEPAGFGLRITAGAIDWLILGCAFSILWTAFWLLFGDPTVPLRVSDHPWAFAAFWAIIGMSVPVYFIYSIGLNGQTLGMSSLDLAVVHQSGEALSYRTAALRFIAMFPCIVSVAGILWALWDEQGRMLHDRLTHTRVVRLGGSG